MSDNPLFQAVPVPRIVSGGQTGVDRAALDAAFAVGVPCGGWCPAGRRAEDGPIPARYPLRETPSAAYAERTRLNVCDSDATLVLAREALTGGTALAVEVARTLRRPALVLDPCAEEGLEAALDWMAAHAIRTLNVAGPRASEAPGIYDEARAFLDRLLRMVVSPRSPAG